MNVRLFFGTAGFCLVIAWALSGQTARAQLMPLYGHRSVPPTPEQQARVEQWTRLWQAGVVALHTGDYVQAEADARQALALGDAGFSEGVLAGALDGQGREQEALQEYKIIVVDHKSTHPRDLLPYALLLLKTGQWVQAVDAYDEALPLLAEGGLMRTHSHFSPTRLEPTALAVAIHIARGLTYNSASDPAHESQDGLALAEYQRALQLAPDADLANFYYGYGLQRLGRTAQASIAFQKTIEMVQLATPGLIYWIGSDEYDWSRNFEFVLDTQYPYPWTRQPPDPIGYEMLDSPSLNLTGAGADRARLLDGFQDCLMYLAPGSSQTVSLGNFGWTADGNATLPDPGGWAAFGSGSAGTVTPGSDQRVPLGNSFPMWTQINGQGHFHVE